MKVRKCLPLLGALGLLAANFLIAEDPEPAQSVAVFASNRGDPAMNELVPVFEDLLVANVADLGFQVISHEIALGAVSDLKRVEEQNELDALLEQQSSALRLSQNLGASYILYATIDGLTTETRDVRAYDVNFQNNEYSLQATYRILNGATGAAVTAGVVNPSRTIQQTEHAHTSTNGIVRQLLMEASREIATGLSARGGAGALPKVSLSDASVPFSIHVRLDEVSFPEVDLDDQGRPVATGNRLNVQPMAVSVELDGILIGTTSSDSGPASFTASPGLHRLRLSRGDLEPVERMVNIREDLQLNMAMQLDEEARRQWLENTALLQGLKAGTILTEAQAEVLRGQAQMLRQSGFRVDTDEGVVIEHNQSLMKQR